MKKFQYRGTKRWKIQKKGKSHWDGIRTFINSSYVETELLKERSNTMRYIFIDAIDIMSGIFHRIYERYKAS